MDAKTEQMIVTVGAGIIKKVLMLQAAGLVSHGLISSNNTEVFVSLGMAAVGAAWSFWNDYGKAIVLSQLEVLKAKSLAQAEKMRAGGMSPVTVNQIAMKTSMSASDVTAVAATLPAEVKANIAPPLVKILLVAFALALFLPVAPGHAQTNARAMRAPQITGNIAADAKANFGAAQSAVTGKPAADPAPIDVWKAIMTAALPDLVYSAALSSSAGTPASKVRKQCWDALIAANKQAQGANLKDDQGNALVKPDPHFFTDVELLAETIDNLSPTGPLFTSCAGAAEMAKMSVLQFINTAVTGAAGFAAFGL